MRGAGERAQNVGVCTANAGAAAAAVWILGQLVRVSRTAVLGCASTNWAIVGCLDGRVIDDGGLRVAGEVTEWPKVHAC